jgi:fatty acyl-ACP thioesterase A
MPADMKAQNLGWVCTRLHIVVDEYPAWGDMVEVRTWFDSQGKIAARRDWDMYYCTGDEEPNEQCASVGRATSQWVAFNIAKRKLARIPATVIPQFREQARPRVLRRFPRGPVRAVNAVS